MSEYMEDHSVSKLIGSPPGYVGFEDGGQLTDQVRNKPYSIVLFDEIEKASPQVFNILLQILDEGRLTDSKGRAVNFKNTIIVLTSNLGSDLSNILNKKSFGFCNTKTECQSQKKELKNNVMEAIKNNFRPEFINRIDEIIVFNPLTKEDIKKILDIIIKEFKNKTKDFSVSFSEKAINYLIEKALTTNWC
jgi:ATP-dependent Clp protease ATP-binding subunit ClpC